MVTGLKDAAVNMFLGINLYFKIICSDATSLKHLNCRLLGKIIGSFVAH
jgi:hypothetical protein